MADEADRGGLRLMLGSMSESSLGCTAMAQLAGRADVVDLDGPWLLANDPFSGITMEDGRLVLPSGPGFGTTLHAQLSFTPIGA
jgi:L-alanine-DL-glutamate epimerase-like enolase superfamily enzyme